MVRFAAGRMLVQDPWGCDDVALLPPLCIGYTPRDCPFAAGLLLAQFVPSCLFSKGTREVLGDARKSLYFSSMWIDTQSIVPLSAMHRETPELHHSPLASFGDTADSSTPIFPRINVKDPYQRLGISREASEEEIRAARNFLINKYAGHKPSVDAIESAHDRIIMQSFFDRKKPKVNLKKKFREINQSRAVKAIQGRFQTPSSRVIWQTAITYVLLAVLTLVFPTEEGPTLQVAISCATNIYFIYQRLKSGWRTFFYGFGSFFASWFLGTFLMVSVIPPILSGPRNLEVSTACVTYVLLFVASTFLK
ncbi:hypothetical protein GUJ93_ZPchr0012g21377 [Zizania palustris]|uniref:Uncharacterized protein n=1 Tax=Zizania palustris TaxID=103762 RepID=A0A8J5WUZ8_ZIZPA|nr:hypothetical protein GUJ93_ZPchr0012g21377 [Zizania palustris]